MKKLIITIDTEGDDLWSWKQGDAITTNNTLFLDRFQRLCNKYNFFSVWLTNYEMIQDDRYVEFVKKYALEGKAEIGMHLHAWNDSLMYQLEVAQEGVPYSIDTSNGSSVLEVPLTILRSHKLFLKTSSAKNSARSIWHALKGMELWIRPNGDKLEEMKYVLDQTYVSDRDYAMFMIHSSELMPGRSPTFKDERSIEKLYKNLEALFAYVRVSVLLCRDENRREVSGVI